MRCIMPEGAMARYLVLKHLKMRILLFLIPVLVLSSCLKDERIAFPEEIDGVIDGLHLYFHPLDNEMGGLALQFADNLNDTAAMRTAMLQSFGKYPWLIDIAYIDTLGVLRIVEPASQKGSEGADVSQQEHIKRCFQTKAPAMSQSFVSVEGPIAADVIHPILRAGKLLGGVSALFLPEKVAEEVILPIVDGRPFEIWIMEPGGRVLYDQDAAEIGLNVLTDPLYATFPELLAAAERIDREEFGEAMYSFYQAGTNSTVSKKTYWKTFRHLGAEWRIVWAQPI